MSAGIVSENALHGCSPETKHELDHHLPDAEMNGAKVSKPVEKIKEELLALRPPTAFFFVSLHIVGLVRVLMVEGAGLPVSSSAQIAMGSLILGKAVLLADLLPAINRFPDRPLSYNVA